MRTSNTKTEQLLANGNVIFDYDQPLSINQIADKIVGLLGINAKKLKLENKTVVTYNHNNITECFILKSVTYLGNPHPLYKKRIQLDSSINEFYEKYKNSNYNIRLLGAYHYNDLLILVDFDKTQYLERRLHNSSAHVMLNDLYQALSNKIFSKVDYFDNKITTIRSDCFKQYIDTGYINYYSILNLIKEYSLENELQDWIKADDAILEMKNDNWYAWKETEWPGFYLEYLFNKMIKENKLEQYILYKGNIKDKKLLDFDIFFPKDKFYGDLKASDIKKNECPANDKLNFEKAISDYQKFWYIVYEHETIKDLNMNSEMAIKRMKIIGKEYKYGDKISYRSRMKYAVKFKRMYIIELNKVNYKDIMNDFNQGHQYESNIERAPKFKINKKNIDNYIIYSHKF